MIVSEWIRYGTESGFLARPEGAAPLPALIVLQEAWGVDAHIEDVTRRFAAAGYVALAPDLYDENGARPPVVSRERMTELRSLVDKLGPTGWRDLRSELTKLAEPERSRIAETFETALAPLVSGTRKLDAYVPRLLATTRFLREELPTARGQKIGAVGFCMGGGLSALLACHDPALAAAVIFYGSAPAAGEVAAIRCPVLGLYGSLDERLVAGLPAFREAMERAGQTLEVEVYAGAAHAFFNDDRPSYHADAARDAFVRTLALFRRTLSS